MLLHHVLELRGPAVTVDLELHGTLGGVGSAIPDHSLEVAGHRVSINGGRVAVRWRAAPDDSRASEDSIRAWFEPYVLAMSVATGSAFYVTWMGRTLHREDGSTAVGRWLTRPFGYVRTHPSTLDTYSVLAEDINAWADLAKAADRLRRAMDLLGRGLEIAAGEAYMAVELLARSHNVARWRGLGD